MRAKRQIAEAALRADREAAYRRVHPPKPTPATDVASLVRAELERQRRADEEARQRAEEERLRGGPCLWCGVTSSSVIEPDGTRTPDWHPHPRGVEDTWCAEWRGIGGTDEELLDKVAVILRDEGLDALSVLNRLSFVIEPGLAAKVGVIPWVDSGAPPGKRWSHLAATALQLREQIEAKRRADEGKPGWDDIIRLPGSEPGPTYGLTGEQVEAMTEGRTYTDAEARKMIEQGRKRAERESRRR